MGQSSVLLRRDGDVRVEETPSQEKRTSGLGGDWHSAGLGQSLTKGPSLGRGCSELLNYSFATT